MFILIKRCLLAKNADIKVRLQLLSKFLWVCHSAQVLRQCVPCGWTCVWESAFTELRAQSWQCEVRRWCRLKARMCPASTDGLYNVRQIRWTRQRTGSHSSQSNCTRQGVLAGVQLEAEACCRVVNSLQLCDSRLWQTGQYSRAYPRFKKWGTNHGEREERDTEGVPLPDSF